TSAPHDSAATSRGDLRPVSEVRDDLIQGRIDNRDLCAQSDHLVKGNYVIRTHSHATVTDRQSQVSFFRRSVNVDIAAEGIRVLLRSPTQPKNPANDLVAHGMIGANEFAGPTTIFEDGSRRHSVANFLRDFQF